MHHLRHAEHASTIFIWRRLRPRCMHIRGARFAVCFDIKTSPGYGTSDLAWMLLRFYDRYSILSSSDFKLLGLTYYLNPYSVTGVLLYDGDLQPVYNIMSARMRSGPAHLRCPLTGSPLSAWPRSTYQSMSLHDNVRIHRMIGITRCVVYLCLSHLLGSQCFVDVSSYCSMPLRHRSPFLFSKSYLLCSLHVVTISYTGRQLVSPHLELGRLQHGLIIIRPGSNPVRFN